MEARLRLMCPFDFFFNGVRHMRANHDDKIVCCATQWDGARGMKFNVTHEAADGHQYHTEYHILDEEAGQAERGRLGQLIHSGEPGQTLAQLGDDLCS